MEEAGRLWGCHIYISGGSREPLGLPHVHKWRKQGGFGAATCTVSGGSREALGLSHVHKWRKQGGFGAATCT